MKKNEFWKWVLAVICGLAAWGIVKLVLLFSMVGSISSTGKPSSAALPKEGVLLMDMSKVVISEQTTEADIMATIKDQEIAQVGIHDAVTAIKKAAEDPAVKYIYLKTDNCASSITKIEEIRKALSEFRKSGKAIVAYGEMFTSGSYYLASVADKIFTTAHHGGNNFLLGISGRMIFLKDLLDKLGIKVQLIRHGKYKSAGEMYTKSAPSPENMEQNQEMIDSMWETISEETSLSRGISKDSLDYFIENLSISYPEDMVRHNLADEVLTVEGLKEKLTAIAEKESFKDVKMIPFKAYASAKVSVTPSAKKNIAVIYADGGISEGNGTEEIQGDRYASIIAKVRADSSVKAVVLRVNSPGGTVLASNKIKEQIDLTRAVKPVIASYGDYAASGGYWISNSCDHIFASKTTLTGSIGVFATVPNFGETIKNVAHINVTPVKSHSHSDMLGMTREFDSVENAWMQDYVDDIYTQFASIVAESRGKTYEQVDSIAQGRVWTGAEALKIGLVDEIGTLEDAIAYAASYAGDDDLSAWGIASYPKPLGKVEQLLAQLTGKDGTSQEAKAFLKTLKGTPLETMAGEVSSCSKTWMTQKGPTVYARLPFVMEIK